MDEKDNSARPKRTRVLRAADVMPPFDKLPEAKAAEGIEGGPSERAVQQSGDGDSRAEQDAAAKPFAGSPSAPDMGRSPAAGGEIPKYDLAENILAEQRRVASRRRRSPGQAQEGPVAVSAPREPTTPVDEELAEDLPELQRIVAEIVAKDIDRLCRRAQR
ncbi:MAG TPA: hypothetical protein PKH24_16240 [Sedimentisphaerales bacterium]|nr:hypothetical protein [Sedimentisphaerales bacterium]HNU30664.1 hypothetical protein [Sedimentisphaerales bacterium]